MSSYPNTGSTLTSKISTGLSTQIIVKVNTEAVGAIQNLSISQTRNVERVREVGMDGVLEAVPNQATVYEATIERIVFDRLRLPEAFSRGFINIKAQLIPFDIEIIDRTNGENEGAVVSTLKNCWFSRYNPTYRADNYILSESATIVFEDIVTTLGGSSSSAVSGGARGINYDVNARERQTDTSNYRGTLDVSDIVNQSFES